MNRAEAEAALVVRLTPEFFGTLREAMMVVGWARDLCELGAFESDLHELAGLVPPPPRDPPDFPEDAHAGSPQDLGHQDCHVCEAARAANVLAARGGRTSP